MGFLPVFYAFFYSVVAFAAYAFCHGSSRIMPFRWRVFWAILGFGASSYIGCIAIVVTLGQSPLAFLLDGALGKMIWSVAYVLSGSIGAWLGMKLENIKSSKPVTPST